MKKTLLFTIVFFSVIVVAAQSYSRLTISTTGSSNLKIRFANKKYSLQDRSTTFQSLTPGTYSLSLFQLQKKQFGTGTEYVKVFDNAITLTGQKHMEICVLRFGKVAVDEDMIERDEWNENSNNPEPDYDRDRGGYRNENAQAVNAASFSQIKTAIYNEFSDDNKMTMAKVVLKNNWFTAEQLKTLSGLFFSDDKKLAFALFAYDFCIEKGKYFILTEELFYEKNKKTLLEFIANHN